MGGQIVTNCRVENIESDGEGKWNVNCNYKGNIFNHRTTSLVHCWNGYGDKDKFLPKRLASLISFPRCQVVSLKNSGITMTKLVCYEAHLESKEEFIMQRQDRSIILGGYEWI